MIRKTALLAGVAGAMLFAAPALAQDAPPAATAQTEAPPSITVQPGATVKGAGGVELGQIQGVRANAAGEQELEVRGADGQLRAVPVTGLQQDGDGLMVGWTLEQYQAAPTIQASTPAPAASPAPAMPATPPSMNTANPPVEDTMTPETSANPPADETMDPAAAEPEAPTAPPPTLPPEQPAGSTPANPAPGEGAPPTTPPTKA